MHWSSRRKAQAKVAWEIIASGMKAKRPLQRARVSITRRTTGVAPDPDNLVASAKLILDALVQLGIIADDTPDVVELEVNWEQAKKKADQGVRLQVGLR